MKTNMKYKAQMHDLKKNREQYFPLMEVLLYAENRIDKNDPPVEIRDISQIALIMELIDIGYLDKDTFIINKNRRDITGMFYKGDYPLTEAGAKVYRQHLHERRIRYIQGFMLLVLVLLGMVVFYIMFK